MIIIKGYTSQSTVLNRKTIEKKKDAISKPVMNIAIVALSERKNFL